MADALETVQILRELTDSIQKHNALLEAFIDRLESGRPALRDATPRAGGRRGGRDAQAERVRDTEADREGQGGASGSAERQDDTAAGRLRSFASRVQPLLKEWAVFYRANKVHPVAGSWNLMERALADAIEAVAPQPRDGVATKNWKYWIPAFDPAPGDPQTISDRLHVLPNGGGHPDYVPPWELRKIGGQLFHVDDIKREQPLNFTEEAIDSHARVPYSFTPPTPGRVNGEALIASSGITVDWDYLRGCLGTLYSVPPDGRIPLSFERNELRLKCATGEIDPYLGRVKETLKELHQKGGSLYITDLDTFGNSTTYFYSEEDLGSFDNESFCWKAATPSLLAECAGLVVYPCLSGWLTDLADFKRLTGRPWFEGPDRYYDLNPEDNVIRRPRVTGFVDSRNWYRVIRCQGLASIMGFANSKGHASFRDAEEKWRALVYSSTTRPRVAQHRNRVIQEAFNLHIFCSGIQRAGNPHLTRWKPFHITWFQIVSSEQEHLPASSWKSGPLYGSTKRLLIQEACFTMVFLPHREPHKDSEHCFPWNGDVSSVKRDGTDFWTILLLTPLAIPETQSLRGNPATYVLLLIKQGLQAAADAWDGIRAHFNAILDDQDTMLDPRAHDELLFDDDTFSRSRLYFWAMDSLEKFLTQIKDTISEWEDFWAARETMIRTFEQVYWERCSGPSPEGLLFRWGGTEARDTPSNLYLGEVRDQINRLRDYQVQFEAFRAKTDALRGGLFNASSVIESRAATRLGENVKLLTYVSIFYLPLSFCAALWSMNEGYDIAAFAVTSALVATGTYIVVGNLDNLIFNVKTIYSAVKRPIVDRMGRDLDQPWVIRSEHFNSFQPRRMKVKPSEWYIVLFRGLELLRILRIVKRPRGDLEASSTGEARPGSGA